ncbi:DUF2771 domain-containing protein [Nocardia goodfellowii]
MSERRKLSGRTIIALLAVATLVVVGVAGAVVFNAVRNAPWHAPELTAYAHGQTVDVTPFAYCSVTMRDCRVLPQNPADAAGSVFDGLPCKEADCQRGRTTSLEVPPGYPLQVSLPSQIVNAPWLATLVYVREDGQIVIEEKWRDEYPEGARAITIDSRPLPELRLVGVEIQLPILARDESGREGWVPHAAWSISTAQA